MDQLQIATIAARLKECSQNVQFCQPSLWKKTGHVCIGEGAYTFMSTGQVVTSIKLEHDKLD